MTLTRRPNASRTARPSPRTSTASRRSSRSCGWWTRKPPAPAPAPEAPSSPRDGGDDGHRVPGLERRGLGLQEAHVLVVDEQPDVAPEVSRRVAQPVLQPTVPGLEALDQGGHVRRLQLHLGGPPRDPAQGPRYPHSNRHVLLLRTLCRRSVRDFEGLPLERLPR